MKERRILALILAFVMVACVFAGCGTTEEEQTAAVEESKAEEVVEDSGTVALVSEEETKAEKLTAADTLVIGVYGYQQNNFNPSQSRNYPGIAQCYDTLFYSDRTGAEWETKPLLAESWEYEKNEDGVWVFHVKIVENATFASGEPVTAEDVLYSYAQMAYGSWASLLDPWDIEASYVEGDYDVYFVGAYYCPNVIDNFNGPNTGVVNKEWAENAADEDWWDQVDESGPFTVVENVDGSHILLQVRDDYWGWGTVQERPNYDYMKVIFYSEASTMVIDYENGAIDMACAVQKSDVDRIQSQGGIEHSTLALVPTGTMMSLVFNENTEILQDVNIRKAIAYAMDVEGITAAVAGVLGETSIGYISPDPAGDYFVEFGANEYNLEKAKECMAEAGYPDGGFELKMVIKQSEADQNFATILQAELAELGISLVIEEYETSTAIQNFREGNTDLMFNLFTSGTYPATVYNNRMSNTTLLSAIILDDQVQEWLQTGKTTEDTELAHEVYANMQNWQHDNCSEVPMYEQNTAVLYKDYVDASSCRNYQMSGIVDFRFADLIVD